MIAPFQILLCTTRIYCVCSSQDSFFRQFCQMVQFCRGNLYKKQDYTFKIRYTCLHLHKNLLCCVGLLDGFSEKFNSINWGRAVDIAAQ